MQCVASVKRLNYLVIAGPYCMVVSYNIINNKHVKYEWVSGHDDAPGTTSPGETKCARMKCIQEVKVVIGIGV